MARTGTDAELLLLIAQRTGLNGSALLSTGTVANPLHISQQSASLLNSVSGLLVSK